MSKHLFPDQNGLRNVEEVRKLKEAFFSSLQRELALNPPLEPVQGDVGICDLLVNKCTTLRLDPHPNSINAYHTSFFRELSTLHLKVSNNFRRNSSTSIEFPALYGELFHELS